jgi:ribosome biogenesis GTPase
VSNAALASLGWNENWAKRLAEASAEGLPHRVVRHDGIKVLVSDGVAVVHATFPRSLPLAVGDWVVVANETVTDRLDRTSELTRDNLDAGPQTIAANIDLVLVVFGADRPLRRRKVLRFAAFAWDIGARPIAVLSKIDLSDDSDDLAATLNKWLGEVEVIPTSVATGEGLDRLFAVLSGRTGTLLGESGAGKSSLVNALMADEVAWVGDVRETDSKGRHTTTHRELHLLPGGGMIIDNPGIRALGLSGDGEGVDALFSDIDALTLACRFRDCGHDTEPGCAVLAAVADGRIESDRVDAYRAFIEEQVAAADRSDAKSRLASARRDAAAARKAKEAGDTLDF